MSQPDTAIELDQVTRFYGNRRGVMDVSVSIPKGSLVGLLGPNGAGKSTTIRILSCHIPPTSGRASVCGYDVFSQSIEVRRRIGYLPENCPLYREMRVLEYLRWTAGMKGMRGSECDEAVFRVLDPCCIQEVRRQPIRSLSKGFRQRVGLAAALLHRPEVLILDEPTIGLDPVQIREFRSLIQSLRKKHTVLISSHILSEIESVCDSVVIINEGRVIAQGEPASLTAGLGGRYVLECKADPSLKILLPQWLKTLPGVQLDSYEENEGFARIELRGDREDPRLALYSLLSDAKIPVRELFRRRTTLEDVFVNLVKDKPEPASEEVIS